MLPYRLTISMIVTITLGNIDIHKEVLMKIKLTMLKPSGNENTITVPFTDCLTKGQEAYCIHSLF